jgi:hypothetical protein
VRVVRGVRLELVGPDDGDELVGLHRVAFPDFQLADLARHLRRDHQIVGRDDAGEREFCGRAAHVVVGAVADAAEDEQDEERSQTLHDQTLVSNKCLRRRQLYT